MWVEGERLHYDCFVNHDWVLTVLKVNSVRLIFTAQSFRSTPKHNRVKISFESVRGTRGLMGRFLAYRLDLVRYYNAFIHVTIHKVILITPVRITYSILWCRLGCPTHSHCIMKSPVVYSHVGGQFQIICWLSWCCGFSLVSFQQNGDVSEVSCPALFFFLHCFHYYSTALYVSHRLSVKDSDWRMQFFNLQ